MLQDIHINRRRKNLPKELIDHLDKFSGPVNVSKVKLLSPFRYPGGKTWLVPTANLWLRQYPVNHMVEPFAGGAIIGLSALDMGIVKHLTLCEIDKNVSSVWKVIFGDKEKEFEWLCMRILSFHPTREKVCEELEPPPSNLRERAWQTILRNRMQRGGIMAPGAGLVKMGENGKGLCSRWYPKTLVSRMQYLRKMRNAVTFYEGDALEIIPEYLDDESTAFFIDPPYTVSTKGAGRRLYVAHEVNHEFLFKMMSQARGPVLMTYDNDENVLALVKKYKYSVFRIPMKTTHHLQKYELLIFNE